MALGKKTGGRVKGTPNKTTAEDRAAFRMVYERRLDDLDRWLKETGDGFPAIRILAVEGRIRKVKYTERNPGKAAELLVKMAEHFVPKLAHTTIAGDGDAPAIIERVVHVVKE